MTLHRGIGQMCAPTGDFIWKRILTEVYVFTIVTGSLVQRFHAEFGSTCAVKVTELPCSLKII